MKRLFFLFAIIFFVITNAQRPIITKWNATDGIIKLRILGASSYTFQNVADTSIVGSGTMTSGLNTISLPSQGIYTLSITPNASFRFVFANSSINTTDIEKFIEILQWGDVKWNTDLSSMFAGCSKLQITAADIPDFSRVTDMTSMFMGCSLINSIPNINKWDVGQVTTMANMFSSAIKFNSPIGDWDVSNVVDMNKMFYISHKFNQDLSKWNTAKVENMAHMFDSNTALQEYGSEFNGNIGSWNTAKVKDMSYMFYHSLFFNQDLNSWDVSNVENMSNMFNGANYFNQNLNNWNVFKVKYMQNMFLGALIFNGDISNWNVSNVVNMDEMFYNAGKFNQPLDKWNVMNVTNFHAMFSSARSFNQNLGSWRFNNNYLVYFGQMFDNSGINCENYSKTLQGWLENPIRTSITSTTVGVLNLIYGPAAKPYRDALIAKGWKFAGDYYDPDCSATLSLNDTKLKAQLKMFPNPTADYFMLNSSDAEVISIYDMSGKLLKSQKLIAGQNTVDISSFPKGVYIVKSSTDTAKIIRK